MYIVLRQSGAARRRTVLGEGDDLEHLSEAREDLFEDVDGDRVQHVLDDDAQHRARLVHVRHHLVGCMQRRLRTCVLQRRVTSTSQEPIKGIHVSSEASAYNLRGLLRLQLNVVGELDVDGFSADAGRSLVVESDHRLRGGHV